MTSQALSGDFAAVSNFYWILLSFTLAFRLPWMYSWKCGCFIVRSIMSCAFVQLFHFKSFVVIRVQNLNLSKLSKLYSSNVNQRAHNSLQRRKSAVSTLYELLTVFHSDWNNIKSCLKFDSPANFHSNMISQAISSDFAKVSYFIELKASQLRYTCLWLLIVRNEIHRYLTWSG